MFEMRIIFSILLSMVVLSTQQNEKSKGCQNFDLVTVRNSSTGLQVLIATASDLQGRNLDIRGLYLPSECGPDFSRCNLATFRYNYTLYVLIPSIRGVVAVIYNYRNETDPQFSHHFVAATRDCNVVKTFYTGPSDHYRVIAACMDLSNLSDVGTLYMLEYTFHVDKNGNGFFSERKFSRPDTVYDPHTVSEVVYARDQKRCLYEDNVYFFDDEYVIRFPVDITAIGGLFRQSIDYLRSCSSINTMEYFGGSHLVIRCSNGTAVVYNSCDDSSEYYNSSVAGRGIPYPCSNWESVVYLKNNTLLLNSREFALPLDLTQRDVVTAKCIAGHPPTFVIVTTNGTTLSMSLEEESVGNETIHVLANSCSVTENGRCFQPIFNAEDENILGTFDTRDKSEFVVANFTKQCGKSPVSYRVHIPTQPDLAAISLRSDTCNCTCEPKHYDLEIRTETTMPAVTTPSPNIVPVNKDNSSIGSPLISVIALSVIAMIVIGTIIIIAAILCYKRRSQVKAVKYSLQSITQGTADPDQESIIENSPLPEPQPGVSFIASNEDISEVNTSTVIPIAEQGGGTAGVDVAPGFNLPHQSNCFQLSESGVGNRPPGQLQNNRNVSTASFGRGYSNNGLSPANCNNNNRLG